MSAVFSLLVTFSVLLTPVATVAQVMVPFAPRTVPSHYKIRGDFAMLGNTNLTLVTYADNGGNGSPMEYVDVDANDSTFNSSSSTLVFSGENSSVPACSDILFAGLYWTGRTDDDATSPITFNVTRSIPTGTAPVNQNYNVVHNNTITNTNYILTVSRGGSAGNYHTIFTFTGNGNTYVFNLTNNAGVSRLTLSVNGGGAVNIPVTYVVAGNVGTATLTTPYVIVDGTLNITINQLVRDSRLDRTTTQTQAAAIARVNVSGTAPTYSNYTKTFDKRKVKIKGPLATNYTEVTAAASDIFYPTVANTIAAGYGMYSAFKDITSYVQTNGIGSYTVADVALVEGSGGLFGFYGGWGMVVVYENYLMDWRDITVFDGHNYVPSGTGTFDVPVSGFQTTPTGAVNLRVGVMAGEGDVGVTGDYFQIRNAANSAWVSLSHTGNTTTNYFNSSIATGGNARNPNLLNNTGLDISSFTVPNVGNTVMTNNQTSTTFRCGSTSDTYCFFNICISSDSYVPEVEGLISVTNVNGSPPTPGPLTVSPGDTIQYTVDVRNIGTEAVAAHTITIPIPYGATFIPGSLSSNITFTPLPTPNNLYFDPNAGSTGSIIWDFGTLPLPADPQTLLASLTFSLQVSDNCLLLNEASCADALAAVGSLTGTGTITGFGISNTGLISGYETSGACQGQPITDPLIASIVVPPGYISANCTPQELDVDFNFCNGLTSIPLDSVNAFLPIGTRFFNEFPVTNSSTEYTSTFPAVAGSVVTYYAVPSILGGTCAIPITITICSNSIFANDDFLGSFNCVSGGTNVLNVLSNDQLGPNPATTSNVTLSVVTPDPTGHVTINSDGSVDIVAGTPGGTYTVTYQICENSLPSNCDQAVLTIQDNVAPTAVCQNITVGLNAGGTVTITAGQVDNGSSDACGIASMSVSPSSFTCANIGANTVTLTVTDLSGNVSTCTATVTVVDNTAPTAVCQNISVNLSAGGTATITAAQINNGSSDNCGIASISILPSSFTCANVGANSVTLTVTDVNGNVSTCIATVTVNDVTPPTAVCQNISLNLNAVGTVTIIASQINNGSTDVCGIASLSIFPTSFSCANVGTNTVTLTVTDVNGNVSTCTSTVTVVDNIAPTAVCQNVTVQLGAGGTASVTAAQVNNGSSDNCGIASLSVSPSSFTCANVGANTVTLTVTDVNGNVSTCTATVTVQDNIAPTAVCQNITLQLSAGGAASVTAAQVNNGSSDNCGIASLAVSPSSFTCANVGANTVTLTVTDVNGRVSTCTATVTVQDNVVPVAVCQNITVQLNAGGTASITAAQINNGSSDACGIASLSVSPSSFTCANVGANTVTLTVTDVNGNTSTCTATVTVQDNIVPVAVCQNITVQLNSSGTVSITAAQINNGSSDACGIASLAVSPSSFTCANVGANTVTLTVTDAHGNISTCNATVTVVDVTPPTAICQNISVNLSAGGTASITAAQVNNGSSDACGIATISVSPSSFTCANVGANTVTLTVTDVNGNVSTCTATVTVVDITPPTAVCQNITVNLSAGGTATITAAQINNGSSDACGIASISVSPSSFTCANVGANTVTLTVTDVNGNVSTCTATVTVRDVTNPIAVCQNISVNLSAGGTATITAAQINNGSSDACGIASLAVSPSSFTCANVGANTVTLTVTDVNGNISTCTASVTINDITNPTAVCQNITVNLSAGGTASITAAQVNNGSSDACGIASLAVSPSSFTCANVGANTVTLTVTDVNGNVSTCTATVTINDVTPPTAICQNITVNLNSSGNATITAAQINNGSSDACGIASLAVSPSSFTCANVGANTVTLTVTDIHGNISTCTATATVVDQVAPTALCRNVTVVLNAAGTASISASQVNNGSSDNCGIATVTVSPSAFTCANVGANNVVLTVTDIHGNVSTCSAIVTVQDNTAPVAVCQNITVALSAIGTVSISGAQVNNGSTDACGIASLSVSPSTFTCTNVGANTVTLTVTDVNGNSSTCTATVTVTDNIAPTAVCQNITVNLNSAGTVSITAAQVDNGSGDVCGTVTLSVTPSTFTCANVGANTVTLTVTDANGNSSSCTATVTVVDVTPPTAICQNISVNLSAGGTASITAAQINNGSSDACGIASLSVSPSSFTCVNVGANTVTLTVTDVNGNSSTCTATVTVVDNIAPTAVCQNVTIQLNALGNASATAAQVNNGSSDNCGIASLSVSPSSFTCANVGANTVTLTVTDVNGNVSTCTATVTVQDNIAPSAICRNITVQLNSSGNASITAAQVNNGSSDNCSIASLTVSPSSFTCANVGANTVTLTVTDIHGNVSTCTATVTVQDNVAPIAICQNITVALNAAGTASITAAQINNGSSDACGIASLSVTPSTFNCSNVGANTVTLTVTDVNGNSSTCTATVTIQDNVAPIAICQNITVALNAAGTVTITGAQVNNGSSDACGISSLSVTPSTFTCANVGPNSVTLTVTDVNGNSSTCTATVTIQDNFTPIAVCQNIVVNLSSAGTVSITAAQVNNGSTDNCAIASMSVSPSSFTCANIGANTVTLTVTDVSGNSSTCTATVTIVDITPPTALCQNITAQLNAAGNVTITAAQINNGSSDACGIASISVSPSSFTCAGVGPNPVTLTVTDVNGNISTCSATVTVVDNIAPVATCQNISIDLDATGNISINATQVDNGSSDACGIASISVSPNSFTCANVGPNTVTLTVTDENGNVSTCTSTVTVVDNTDPIAVCQNISINLNSSGTASITAAQINNGSSDACGIASIAVSPSSFTCANVGVNNVTLTVTDVHGNSSTCSATVTVADVTPPTAVCQNITVQLNSSGNASITAAQINNGSSDACGIASIAVSPSSFTCANVGANTVTLTVTDIHGNVSTCTATVTVQDNVAPVANCQNITVNLSSAGTASITAAQINNNSTDACGIFSLAVSPSSFTCANIGANTVTLTVTDVNGNVSTCTATVTIVDNTNPVAVCQNITVNLSSAGSTTITASQINNGSSDACGIASMTVTPSSFTCANVGANSVTLTVTDNNGNSTSCNAIVTVVDITAPIAICQNVTVQLDAGGNASVTAAQVNNGSSDACGIASLSVSPSSFTCANVGANTVTLTVTDVNGNSSTCTATVTVQDNVDPVAICQNITVALDANGDVVVTAAQINNGSTDNCGIASITLDGAQSQLAFDCSNVGANTVTLTVTDVNGNSSTCTATVSVEDNIAPNAICQNITAQLDANGDVIVTAVQINNGSNDNCGIASITLDGNQSQLAFDCSNVGANTVTLTVTDVNGNTSTCLATITVVDNVDPIAICQNITAQLDANGQLLISAAQINNGSNDNCGIASITLDGNQSQLAFDCSDVGVNTVTLTITDVNGNSSSCTATVTVQDNVDPTAICQSITVQLDQAGNAVVTAAQINNGSSDNCGIASIAINGQTQITFNCLNVGTNTVTLTVTDVNGNISTCSATVTVLDNASTPPTAICQNITVQLDASGNASILASDVDNGSFDNCGIASMSVSPNTFNCTNVGANTVTLSVTDLNGNVATCSAIVTVEDTIAPMAICQNLTVQLDATGNLVVTAAQINNGSNDACGIATVTINGQSQLSYNCGNVGANTVTLTVTDVNGNISTCSATITVQDNVAPNAICQNITAQLDANGNIIVSAAQINNGSNDNCGIASITINGQSQLSYNCGNVGVNNVTLTVTDVNGNVSTCTATITVVDNINPTAICQNITAQLNSSGQIVVTAAQINNGSSDNCGIASIAINGQSQLTYNCANVGANIVTLTVTDVNGNVSSCTATITVVDNINPTSICQNITIALDANGNAVVTAAQIDNGSNDNCGIASIAISGQSQLSFNCLNVGANTVTLTVTDINGNVSSCIATITVVDNAGTPPTAICQNITVQLDATGNASITANQINNGSFDNCGVASLSVSPNTFDCGDIGLNTVTLTVTDLNGNSSQCTATVTIEDNVAPVANCQNITVQLDATGNATIAPGDVDNGSSDACGIASITVSPNTFTCANVGANTVTLTVTDVNGNITTCTATATVEDNVAPIANCQNITVQLDASGNAILTAAQINNNSTDNCGIASINVSTTSFTCSNIGANNVTLTVTDVNGNSASCSATVTIQDHVAPIALCQNITVQLNAAGIASITAAQINNGSSDACGIASLSVSPSSFTCSNVGTNTVTLTVTDNHGNISTCTAIVTVQDNTDPIAICQNITVNLDANGNAVITAAQVNNNSSDACGIASMTVSPSTFDCSNIGANTVTLTVTDNNGNASSCTATVTIEDNTNPTVICQNITVQLDANGNVVIVATDIDNGSSDNCSTSGSGLTFSASQTSFDCSNIGANTITLTVTDAYGNSSSCDATVTVVDTVNPIAICQNITVQLDASGNATILAIDIDGGSTDNCSDINTGLTFSASQTAFDCTDEGANTVILTVTDAYGNVSTCTAIVTIENNVAPAAVCQDITVQLDATGNVIITAAQVDGGTNAACGIASLTVSPSSFDCSDVGANTVTLTATDNSGNVSTCTAVVTVQDTINPTIVCQNITVALDANGNVVITGVDLDNGTTDNCSTSGSGLTYTASQTNFDCSNIGANTITLTVTDANGNSSSCDAIVTVTDTVNPTVICQSITVQLDANGNAVITAVQVDNGSFDNCSTPNNGLTYSISNTDFDCSNVGANTVTLTVTDAFGNSSSCTATVTITDDIDPIAICQDITVQLDANGQVTINTSQVNNGSSDNCGIATMTVNPSSFTCAGIGTNPVTLTVTDVNGNVSTCISTVTVQDNVDPIAICRDITIDLDGTGNISIVPSQVDNGSGDACGIASMTVSPNTFDCLNVGANTVTLVITDLNGNVDSCTSVVTVVDATAPNAICHNITVALDSNGVISITAAQIDNGSTDACGIDTMTVSTSSFDCSNIGENLITLTVTDVNGNSDNCFSTVTVVDNIAPEFTLCPADIVIQPDSSNCNPFATWNTPIATDNCAVTSLTSNFQSGNNFPVGVTTVIFTAIDASGNTTTCTFTVTVLANPLLATAVADTVNCGFNIACPGGTNGTATVLPAGGCMPYSYLWNNGQTSQTATGLSATTYSVTVTDGLGNTATTSVTLTEPSPLVIDSLTSPVNAGGWNINCANTNNGIITINVLGGADCAPYSYSWTGPNGYTSTDEDLNIVYAGTYYVTITDINNCSITDSITLTEPELLVIDLIDQQDVSCNGLADGFATVLAGGGAGGYQYLWSNGKTSASADSLDAGIYFVSVTDNNGCIANTNVVIGEPTLLIAAATITSDYNGQDVTCAGANDGSAQVLANGGTPGYTYLWTNGSTDYFANDLTAGTYFVTVTDTNGCDTTVSVTLVDPPVLSAGVVSVTNVTCNSAADGSATVQASGGTPGYFYYWSNTQTGATATGLAAGTHNVTVSDTNGCNIVLTITITEPDVLNPVLLDILDVTCNGGSNGAGFINVTGGTEPYTYLWSNGATTEDLNGVGAGDYTVQITDANGCDTSFTLVISQPTPMVAFIENQVNVYCAGNNTGEASVNISGGVPGYTYLWDNGQTTQTVADLSAGPHSITIRDANNCITIVNFVITESIVLSAGDVDVNNVTCNGGNNGSISFNMEGGSAPYSYVWSNGQTTVPAINLQAGDHSVTITDSAGCVLQLSFTVSQPDALTLNIINIVQPVCSGSSTGHATVQVTGGTPNYQYAWDNGQTTATATGFTAGVHTVVVTDANGCVDSTTVTITEPASLSVSIIGSSNPTCFGGANGTATALVGGGVAPYDYSWSPSGGTNSTATGLSAGTHIVIVTDANGCSASQTYTLTQPAQVVVTIDGGGSTICAGESVTLTASATGGTGSYNFAWNNGLGNGATHTVSPTVTTTYVVIAANAQGCSATDSVTVSIYPSPAASFTPSGSSSCTFPVTVNFTNTSTNSVTYYWEFGNGDSAFTTNGQATYDTIGSYTVMLIATSTNGCTDTALYVYNVYPAPTALFSLSGNSGCAPYTVSFTNNSVDGVTYYWSFGDGDTSMLSNPSHTYEIPGTYNVTLVVSGGGLCNDTLQLLSAVTVFQTPVADFTSDYFNITDPDGQIQFTNLSTGATSYDWDFGDGNTSTLTDPINNYLENGEFDVTLIAYSGAGCSDTIIQTVEVELMKGLYMPNAMIAGGDGDFGLFLPKGAGIATYQCMVFDKWGNLLWQSTELVNGQPSEGWDGRYNGVVVPLGAYIWKADATFLDGTTWEGMEYENDRFSNTGNVTVLE